MQRSMHIATAMQVDALAAAGCEKIFEETVARTQVYVLMSSKIEGKDQIKILSSI